MEPAHKKGKKKGMKGHTKAKPTQHIPFNADLHGIYTYEYTPEPEKTQIWALELRGKDNNNSHKCIYKVTVTYQYADSPPNIEREGEWWGGMVVNNICFRPDVVKDIHNWMLEKDSVDQVVITSKDSEFIFKR